MLPALLDKILDTPLGGTARIYMKLLSNTENKMYNHGCDRQPYIIIILRYIGYPQKEEENHNILNV